MNGTERHPITSLDGQPLRLQSAATLDVEELVRRMRTRPDGLSTEEAAGILRLVGPNRLPRSAPPGLAARLVSQFTHFFALMLWAAAVLAMVGGLPQLAIAIVLVILVNGIFSFAQEERATKAAAALSDLMPTFANVLRDGRPTRVDAVDLVPGDIVQVREGDRVSADAR
jgi:magnesium-transporting ATPase (P-type)